ncbi:MAG: aminopeptidase, partial [Deltaproteobacteria bacterium]
MIPALHALDPNSPESLATHDALVVVSPTPLEKHLVALSLPAVARAAIESALAIDAALGRGARPPVVISASGVPGNRIVLSTVGALADDGDDVRMLAEAAAAAVSRAVEAGARGPALFVAAPAGARYVHAREVAALAALGTHWLPLEALEAGKRPPVLEALGVAGLTVEQARVLHAIETGRALARDITGTEPERMAPLRVAEMCEAAFAGTGVKVTVTRDVTEWPLIAAVSRASMRVERHRPCVVRLEYVPEGPVSRTLYVAGKGVTYDTGGSDLKTDGSMAGMSRDKGGAGAT